MGVSMWEFAARMFEPPPPPRWATPGDLAQFLDSKTVQTPALDLIDAALVEAFNTPDARLIISCPPQEGKSQRAARRFPLWALTQNPDLRIAIASYESNVAKRWGRAIRDDIAQDGTELGLSVRSDLSAQSEWQLDGHEGGVFTAGVGGAMTGRAVDVMLIDDPVKGREQADSPTFRERAWDWWQETAATRLAPGAPVVLILTRWHEEDLAGRILKAEDGHLWKVVSIPAQCEDETTDPLKRKLGEFLESARGRTKEQWEAIKTRSTRRTWAALYQQRPAPIEGAVWQAPWIENNRAVLGDFHRNPSRILVSVDPAAKSKATSDMTGIIVTAIDAEGMGWVLDDRTTKGTPLEWATEVWSAVLDWNADEVLIEDNQGGEMVVDVLNAAWRHMHRRKPATRLAPRVRTVTARLSKRTRAEAISALYETGRVKHLTDGTSKLSKLEDQMLSWTGTGDSPDRIDALVHGLTALFKPGHSSAGVGNAPRSHRWAGMRGR